MQITPAIQAEAKTILELCQGNLMAALKVAESQLWIHFAQWSRTLSSWHVPCLRLCLRARPLVRLAGLGTFFS